MGDETYDGTAGAQYVTINGTKGETEELQCVADFNVIDQDVECTVSSNKIIGEYRCLIWKTTTNDGWVFKKVIYFRFLYLGTIFLGHYRSMGKGDGKLISKQTLLCS